MKRSMYMLAGVICFLPTLALTNAYARGEGNASAPYKPETCSTHITSATADVAKDPDIAPAVRKFLVEIDRNPSPFWTLPQPKPQEALTTLQSQTPVDMSAVTTTEETLKVNGRDAQLYIMRPERPAEHPGAILFLHGGVWLVGNFENHKRLLHDIVVESGQPAVFLQYTTLPQAKYPAQMDQAYAALQWTFEHAPELGADPNRIAVVGNSVGGNMTAALTLMAKDRDGPKIDYQVLLWPATNAGVDTCSYNRFANDRFLSRAFMKYGWDLYAPTEAERNNPYISPLRASLDHLRGLPPALVITDENDVLRDEGEAYARRLQDADVPTVSTRYDGTIHDFGLLNALADLPTTKAMISQVADGIRLHIGQ